MLDWLIGFAGSLGHWGYLLLFLAVVLECQACLGLFMPGETLVLAGGLIASQGGLDPGVLILVISIAAICGDSLGYKLGRWLGREWLLEYGKRFGLRLEHFKRADDLFARHGGKVAFGSHFLYLLRALVPFVAGDRRMRYGKFLGYDAMGCTLWASVLVALGYVAGESWRMAAASLGFTGKIVGGLVLLAVALIWLWRWRRRHQAEGKRQWRELRAW